ncbi:MAG: DUF58 domain-containing protein [Leptolyngbya sp.]|nr:DUF58 domain-containing protein [Leptolyngbya sp.]
MDGLGRWGDWLERRGLRPAYAGGLLLSLAIFLFAAATNTMAGWLYVMSGIMLALLALATRLPRRHLRGITVDRSPIDPVSVGEGLAVDIRVTNHHRQPQGLFQLVDALPPALATAPQTALRHLSPGHTQVWRYQVKPLRRGVYHWETFTLRSAAPLGLFWYRRDLALAATAVVYPQVFPLQRCPILDTLGHQSGQQWHYHPVVKPATEGVTRSLRPYRWGDPTRLIHWRTSARYGELRVRELERVTASQEVVIALNTLGPWTEDGFEQAVIAAASLYHYALDKGFAAALWLPRCDLLQDRPGVLLALAGVQVDPSPGPALNEPEVATVWLTPTPLSAAPLGSRQLVWSPAAGPEGSVPHGVAPSSGVDPSNTVIWMQEDQPIQAQLQASLAQPSPATV